MSQIKFMYQGNLISIQCDANETIKDICLKFTTKLSLDIKKLFFLYNGGELNINEELKLRDLIKGEDKNLNEIIILVNGINEDIKTETII